ncbi:MAG: hypothetical protein ACPIOQ_71200 [Promethearchaeia archaeon]
MGPREMHTRAAAPAETVRHMQLDSKVKAEPTHQLGHTAATHTAARSRRKLAFIKKG